MLRTDDALIHHRRHLSAASPSTMSCNAQASIFSFLQRDLHVRSQVLDVRMQPPETPAD